MATTSPVNLTLSSSSASSSFIYPSSSSFSTMESFLTESSEWSSTVSMNGTNEKFVSDTAALVMSVFLNIIAVLGIVGNSVVIVSVVFCRKLQTATNVFVIVLSVTDLFVCLTLPFQTIALTSEDGWPLPDWLCASIGGITSICFGASVLLLVLIAINRFFVITRPRSTCRRFYKSRNLAMMVGSAYLYTIVMFAILPIAGVGRLGYAPSYRICAWDEDHELGEINDYIVALTFGLSFVVILVCYIRIFTFIRKHHRVMLSHRHENAPTGAVDNDFTSIDLTETQLPTTPSLITNSNTNVNNDATNISQGKKTSGINKVVNKREIEITKNLFLVICSFFVCIAPYSVSLALPSGASFSIFTGILLMSNACINPVIYSFKHPTFKVVIRCVMCCRYADIPKPSATLKKLLNLGSRGH